MRRRFILALMLAAFPATLAADVTIRYATTMSSPSTPADNKTGSRTVYMKGNMGVMIDDDQTTIVDFARQVVTIVDTKAKTFASLPASEYEARFAAGIQSAVETPEGTEIRKSMKATCEKTTPGTVETIQGIRAEEYDVTCISTTIMPESSKQFMRTMTMKSVRRLWLATPGERLRVPGLWQLSGFESWQEYFMSLSADPESDGEKTMLEALRKGQSATLRTRTEMSMKLPNSPGPDGYTQFFGTSEEMVSLSTEVLDGALFHAPADFREEPFETVVKEISAAAESETASRENDAAPKLAIPENVKAFVPVLFPLHQTEPVAPLGPDGNKLQGMVELLVTVGPQGNVEQAEVLTGPEGLRQAANDAVSNGRSCQCCDREFR